VDRLADDVAGAAQEPLPGLVGHDDRARLLLLHDVLEILTAIRAAEQGRDARDGQPADVDRHLEHAAHFDAGQRDRCAPALEEAERLERVPVLQDGLNQLPVRR